MISLGQCRNFFPLCKLFYKRFFKSLSKHSWILYTGLKHLIFSKGAIAPLVLLDWNPWGSVFRYPGFELGLSHLPPASPGWWLARLSPVDWPGAMVTIEGPGWVPRPFPRFKDRWQESETTGNTTLLIGHQPVSSVTRKQKCQCSVPKAWGERAATQGDEACVLLL